MTAEASDIVAAVLRVPGVSSADLETDAGDGTVAVHVGITEGADGRAVADAVNRALHEQLGSTAAPARVHLLEDEAPEPHRPHTSGAVSTQLPVQATARPSIVRVDVVTTGLEHAATVALTSRTRAATGEARGIATVNGMRRAAATATLRALERLLRDEARLELEQVMTTGTGADRTVVVVLTMVSGRGTEQLTGAAVLREDEPRAIVRATLDALNRRLEALLH